MKAATEKVIVTLRDICLIDIPPHANQVFIKAKQSGSEITSKSVSILNNMAKWIEPLVIECKVTKKSTEKHTEPLRLSFRFENVSGNSFQRYGIAEIDCTTVFHENIANVQSLLSNCTHNTRFQSTIDIVRPGETRPRSNSSSGSYAAVNITSDEGSFSDKSINQSSIVTTTTSGGTSVSFAPPPKLPHELAPIKVSLEVYQMLEHQVDAILSEIIVQSRNK